MNDVFELLLTDEPLSGDQRRRLHEALREDPTLREALRHWGVLVQEVSKDLDEAVPSRRLLVLYALERSSYASALDEDESAAVAEAREDLEEALARHPGLEFVVEDIRGAAESFDAEWAAHAGEKEGADRPDRPARATDRSPRPQTRQHVGSWRSVGLILALLIAVGALLLWPRQPTMTVVQGLAGETEDITLPDGSTVRLVDEARIAFLPDDMFDRSVEAMGTAYFDVVAGGSSFRVATPAAEVAVAGTAFGVAASEQSTEVVLTSGRVDVRGADRTVQLRPGERTVVDTGGAPSTPEAVVVNEALAWTGLLFFHETEMADVVGQLEARFDREVTVDSALVNERVTGTFEADASLVEVAEALAAALGARVDQTDAGVHILPE